MKRLRLKVFLWSVLLISVFLKTVEPASTAKPVSTKGTKTTPKPLPSTTTTAEARATTKSSSRNTVHPKNASKRTTTTSPVNLAVDPTTKPRSSSSNKKKPQSDGTTTTTTLSPMEIMNRLYQMHGLASHGLSMSHANYPSHQSSSSSNPKKKQEQQNSSSMDDIYRLHAMAMAQGSHSNKKHPESSNSDQKTTGSPNRQQVQGNSMEHIYQQHSSLPSSMHNIISQHSVSSHHSSSKPQKSASSQSSSSGQESSSTKLSTLMQPLLKQLTPVGAGIGVVLAPLLLFNGFLQFFSNMSRFLNNFAQTMLPTRRPPMGQTPQSQNAYFQNLGPAHLKRQPREWYMHPRNIEKINEITALFMKALKEAEGQ